MINVFEFTHYRNFLKAYYQDQKAKVPEFSYAVMADKVGISSRGLMKLIIDGQRKLSSPNVAHLIEGFGFNKSEADYFTTLVQFNHASGTEEKNRLYEKLLRFPQNQKVQLLAREQYNLYSKWYYPVVHELTLLKDCPTDRDKIPLWITERLHGRISVKEATTAMKELVALGLLRDVGGRLRPGTPFLQSNRSDDLNFARQQFLKQMITEAGEALAKPVEEREFGAITLAFKKEDLPRAKEAIREFRNKFNFEFSAESSADCVYQLNLQLFELAESQRPSTDQSSDLSSAIAPTKSAEEHPESPQF